jgi:3-oxoacyl-[acyl-carrier-protein] synthase-3
MRLEGIAAYLPEQIWSNNRIAARLRLERMRLRGRRRRAGQPDLTAAEAGNFSTSDRWVRRFIGFVERRFAPEGQGTIDLAARAARRVLEACDRRPSDIDWIVFGRVTPSYLYSPPDAALLQDALGIPVWQGNRPREVCGADVSLACSTWVSGLMLCYALVRSGMARNVLLVGADRMSVAINWEDRSFATVLGDAGTATLCTAVAPDEDWFDPSQFWGWMNGEHAGMITTPMGGSKAPLRNAEDLAAWRHCLAMDGRAVKETIVPFVGGPALEAALAKAGWSIDQIDLVTLHEANLQLNDSIVKAWGRMGFRGEVLDSKGRFGNTTSASIPLAWTQNAAALKPGKRFGLLGFGGGLSASIALGTIRHPLRLLANA